MRRCRISRFTRQLLAPALGRCLSTPPNFPSSSVRDPSSWGFLSLARKLARYRAAIFEVIVPGLFPTLLAIEPSGTSVRSPAFASYPLPLHLFRWLRMFLGFPLPLWVFTPIGIIAFAKLSPKGPPLLKPDYPHAPLDTNLFSLAS